MKSIPLEIGSQSESDTCCHHYYTRLSVRKSMSTLRRSDQEEDDLSEQSANKRNSSQSLFSIFHRETEYSLGEEEKGKNFQSRTRTRNRFQKTSLSSFGGIEEDRRSELSSTPEGSFDRKSSSTICPLVGSRRSSLLLNSIGCDEKRKSNQLVCCENKNSKMDPSCYAESTCRQPKYPGLLPCLIALAALIIIAIPLAKILGCLKKDVSEIHQEVLGLKKQVGYTELDLKNPVNKISSECSAAIKYIVKEELDNFDSDKTGKIDFALESAGGRIVKMINTENYGVGSGFLGFTLCEGNNGPRAIIQANTGPGQCWAFKGSKGSVLIKLIGKVMISEVSLEHISEKISPTGKIDTAPKDFSIYAFKNLKQPKVFLGRFQYKEHSDSIQTFSCKSNNCEPFEYVEFNVESNHGSPDYTCVYRLRVHGTLESL